MITDLYIHLWEEEDQLCNQPVSSFKCCNVKHDSHVILLIVNYT